jgi:betaine-aldehyde dehydrogenase
MSENNVPVYQNYIGGEWVNATSAELFDIFDPATGELIHRAQNSAVADMQQAIEAANEAFENTAWREDADLRTKALFKLASALREANSTLTQTLIAEAGKIFPVARGEAFMTATTTEHYAGLARWIYGRSTVPAPDSLSVLLREPVGVVGVIVPWNMPLALMIRSVAPALAAGCAVIIKPASYTAGTTAEFVKVVDSIEEIPKGIVNMVTGPGPTVGAELAGSDKVEMVAFTGDTNTGKEIMRLAANNLKKVSLELGGKSPNIIFRDADFDRALKGALNGAAFWNAGQVCTAGSRVLVEAAIHDPFIEHIRETVPKMRVGRGSERGVACGPVISESQLQRVLEYIEIGKQEAELVVGGQRLTEGELAKGYFVAPTVFDRVPPDARIAQEEIFGPVLAVMEFEDVEEAARIANDTVYGLVAAVWTNDINKALQLAKKIRAGTVWVNTYGKLFQTTEFGGFKQSGLGRVYGLEGLLEFTELKHIHIQL